MAPGITALVGPNGSGKSNLVDAVRWCLGEQNARDLRASRSEEVLHAGERRVLGAAEVCLTFEASNADPVSIPSSISVSRRLYRSGESEYLVNRDRVRLRDVQDALRAIDLDGARSVVVTQGMADALLAASPAERRIQVEQAAGLGGYRARREEARQKLAVTADNLVTMRMVLAELEPRLRLLRRQTRAVQERETARAQLCLALEAWYGMRWWSLEARLVDLRRQARETRARREETEERLKALEARVETAATAMRLWQRRSDLADAETRRVRHQLDAVRDPLWNAERQLETLEAQGRATEARLRELIEQVGDATGRLATAEETARREQEQWKAAEQRVTAAKEAARAGAERVASLQHRTADRQRKRSALEAEWARAIQAHGAVERELERLRQRREDGAARQHRVHETLEEARGRRRAGEAAMTEAQEALDRRERDAEGGRARLQTATRRLARVDGLLATAGTGRESLKREAGQHARALTALAPLVGGTLLARLRVPPEWTAAVGAALGAWAAAGAEGRRPHPWTESERDGFLTWRESITSHLPAGAIWADTVVDGLGRESPTPLHATVLIRARSEVEPVWAEISGLPGHTAGSPSVLVVSADGVVRSAYGWEAGPRDDRAEAYLRLVATIDAVRRRLSTLDRRFQALEAVRAGVDADVRRLRQYARAAEDAVRAAREQVGMAQAGVRVAEWEIEHGTSEATRLRSLADELDGAEPALLARLESAGAATRGAEEALETFARAVAGEEAVLGAARSEDERLQAEARGLTFERDASASRLAAAERAVTSARQQLGHVSGGRDRLEAEGPDRLTALDAQREEVERLRQRHGSLAALMREREREQAAILAERPEAVSLGQLAELRQSLTCLVGAQERAAGALLTAGQEQAALAREIQQEPALASTELSHPPAGAVPTDEELRRLRTRANQYADADASVAQECEELEQRYERLSHHMADLDRASANLREIMNVTDAEMRTRFQVAYDSVNREFQRVFELMLGGGSAALELVDPDGGIAIHARLPGKRSRSNATFSGGERTLVASSLLFALLAVRPIPFCVLDEVDAALDEMNVDLYLTALRDISTRTQVIVVTHNRATMAAADALYGLTIDDDGVSGLLSLRLDRPQPVASAR